MGCIFQKKVVKANAALLKIFKLCIFQKNVVKDNAALLKIIKLCIFQKNVVKDNATFLKIIKLDTHVVHLPEKGRHRQCTLLKIVETFTKDVFLNVKIDICKVYLESKATHQNNSSTQRRTEKFINI
jgi:hypothetical protein